MLKGFLTVGGWTMLSRILGLVRDQLLAAFMGAGPMQDAYQVAFRLPNMFRRLFGEGAFNAAFVPLFSSALATEGDGAARTLARQAFGVLLTWLIFLCILGEIFMPQVLRVIAPGFTETGSRYDMAVTLSRITFPYLVLICAAALVSGVLNGLHRFSAAAAAYLAFNVVGIAAVLFATPFLPSVAHAAAWGVTVSGVAQLGLLMIAARRAGFDLTPLPPRITPQLRLLGRRMAPGLIGSGVTQINLTIDTIIGTLLPAGSVSLMYFADRLNQLPLGVLGAAAGTTLLPVLTRHLAAGEEDTAHAVQNSAIDYVLLLTLPATAGLLALATPIMQFLFAHGSFSLSDAALSAQSLRAYALGLPAFVMAKVLAPAFFARGDTSTPVKIGFFTLMINLMFNLLLMRPLAHVGPPLASSLAAIVNVAALTLLLLKRDALRFDRKLTKRVALMAGAAIAMAAILCAAQAMLTIPASHRTLWLGVTLGIEVPLGAAFYLGVLHALRVLDLASALDGVRRRLARRANRQK
ncbi:integral membrane protein MviN [Acetobacter nitrogenifigens DSM 23921 = NBRC 105050]|uniref:Probable lipid II flippase MurJ n=1 Tax=Acetobacter nitrogenifigens DSM 23921 = NBRC 105050 TaxID=1120919 RepID=A0A511X6F3_9PROT|nr:murein biosynthesis integral membrane protein MurJ [Acetobacter nitrogenifigens]GBQ94493.1 integral membrane protein MviN [Acetobacter nitrogenifigens DSM 23921 = NBRC 105050]GEN58537.1 putative lipid II flippase MurJ [Acetobacter nitrogenifigens DSM 23921 = NBRC 105050]